MSKKKIVEQVSGSFSAIPHTVMDSAAFMSASHPARALLLELIRQHNGRNNGHFQLAANWLKARGWNSNDVILRAKAELIAHQLAIKTRLGGLRMGPDLWALTWLSISDYSGLTEISPRTYHPGAWHFFTSTAGLTPETSMSNNFQKRDDRTVSRCKAAPSPGAEAHPLAPSPGAVEGVFMTIPAPSPGDNVYTNTLCSVGGGEAAADGERLSSKSAHAESELAEPTAKAVIVELEATPKSTPEPIPGADLVRRMGGSRKTPPRGHSAAGLLIPWASKRPWMAALRLSA